MEPIRIGLIGVTHRAWIAKYWRSDPRCRIVAGCDKNPSNFDEFKQEHGDDCFVTTDVEELAARDDVDAVAVFTPDNWHATHAIAGLRGGKHVFCEKPMAITIEDCQAMIDAERASGRKLMIGFNMRYMDYFNIIKDVIDAGTIGKVTACWVRHFIGYGGWAYFHDYRGNHRGSTSLLLQKASHDIDMLHYLIGEHFTSVVGMGNRYVYGGDRPNDLTCDKCDDKDTCEDFSDRQGNEKQMCCFREEVDVEDHNMIMMQTPSGVQASYCQCHFAPDSWRNYCVIGTKGRIESNVDNSVTVYTQKMNPNRRNPGFHFETATYRVGETTGGHGGSDLHMCKGFLDYIIDDAPPRATSQDGLMAVAVGVKGAESMRNGCVPIAV